MKTKLVISVNQQIVDSNLRDLLIKNNIRFKEVEEQVATCVCGKEFIIKRVGLPTEKKFCSVLCRTRNYARLYHEFNKDNPEFQRKKKEYFNMWLDKNREHFNDLVREPNRIKSKINYDKFDALGLCVQCGKQRDNPNSKTCFHCRPSVRLQKRGEENES
jgi:hypothetical protein